MQTHSLVQGGPAWHSYRSLHFNASDGPAMMGCSPYKTRTQLLHEKKTGLTPEVDVATQRRFEDGHRFEALARPLAEAIMGEDLYPVVGSDGELSASFDGLTMAEDRAFEHKSLNNELRDWFGNYDRSDIENPVNSAGNELPLMYRVQMEHQCMVSGARMMLFMASKWDGESLIEQHHCWYSSDQALRTEIIAGWAQFAVDLAAYVPPAVTVEAIGHTPETLPALRIEVTGMVTASNLADYKAHALAVFAGINRELTTDQHFADADKVVRWCGEVESRLAAAKQHALSQTESIDALFRTIDDISAEAKRVRLELDKLVKARKEAVRGELVAQGVAALRVHVEGLNTRLGKPYMPAITADFAGAVKGKRTIDSLNDAVGTTLANAKIEASATADKISLNLATLRELAADHQFLFADTASIVLKDPEDLTLLVMDRVDRHMMDEAAKEEAQRQRIRQEEIDKLAREKAEADARVKREAEAIERTREEGMRKAVIDAEIKAQAAIEAAKAEDSIPADFLEELSATATFLKNDVVSSIDAGRAIHAAKTSSAPTLRLGQIADRLGFALTADFLRNLGFEPAARDKAALLFHEADFPLICMRLVSHIQHVQARHAA